MRDFLLQLCSDLRIIVNLEKSHLIHSQSATYLGIVIRSPLLRAFPTQERLTKLHLQLEEFLSCQQQPASLWRSLLGRLSSLSLLVPGSRLRMRSLQLVLRRNWDFANEDQLVEWDASCQRDLQWWSEESHLTPGVSLEVPAPDAHLYTDASNAGWGASLDVERVSGLWSVSEAQQSINWRELRAVELSLLALSHQLQDQIVALFSDNTTAVSYLRKAGGTRSEDLNSLAQRILRFCETFRICLLPQFVSGSLNVVADGLSRKNQVLGAEWTLCQEVFMEILKKWPANIDLFATHLNHRLPCYFSPIHDPQSLGTDAMLQSWDGLLAYAFPPFSMVHQVLNKLRASQQATITLIAPF